jgi:hypothetical protein
MPAIGQLDLSGFDRYHRPAPTLVPPPPSKRPCGIVLPPHLTPLPEVVPPPVMPTASSQPSWPSSFPGPHAGLMRPYGGIKRWMAMQRGEIPWPSEEELKDAG